MAIHADVAPADLNIFMLHFMLSAFRFLANASTVVLCYMSCICIYMILNVCVVTVFMSIKSSTELCL